MDSSHAEARQFFESPERECPRCSQPLGNNPDCDNCAKEAKWAPDVRQSLIKAKRKKDRKFGLRG